MNPVILCLMLEKFQAELQAAVKELFSVDVTPAVSVPDEQFGDVASNVAMQIVKQVGNPPAGGPREIAEALAVKVRESGVYSEVSVAGPGFLNARLNDEQLWNLTDYFSNGDQAVDLTLDDYKGVKYVTEYSCPNWFKELHTGHLYQTILGDALARMIERAGATVHRTTFGGDVGLHVAKAMWSILQDAEPYDAMKQIDDPQKRAEFITSHYVKGSAAYEDDEQAADEIKALNKEIYAISRGENDTSDASEVYFTCREWSTEYFHYFYKRIRVDDFERYYPESKTEAPGVDAVNKGLKKGAFEESDGAIVFRGEEYGLHTRVFLTKEGLPTYEAKDVGVVLLEKEHFDFDKRILITGSDQKAYMQVVWCALDQMYPDLKDSMTHLTNGIVKFGDGTKMSSRRGNVTRAVDVLDAVAAIVDATSESDEKDTITLGAIKYEFLKYAVGSDIAFDVNESVSVKGNSGPYLQYAYVRAKRIVQGQANKFGDTFDVLFPEGEDPRFNEFERRLTRKLAQYRSVFAESVNGLSPNTLCLYLYELAQVFNQFYENVRVADSGVVGRWELTSRYIGVLGDGLALLGIELPESM